MNEKVTAQEQIRIIAMSGMKVNPELVRELYRKAEWMLPDHLQTESEYKKLTM